MNDALTATEKIRYSRQIMMDEIGLSGQRKLKSAKVLIIGAGGLGCPVLQYLAAAGVGALGISDGDRVDESNLQRQILYETDDIGKLKTIVAKQKIKKINAGIQCITFPCYVDTTNILDIISGFDVIVDGTDNFFSRYLINDAAVISGKPVVSGSIVKFEGQLSVFNYDDGPTYRCLFPEPETDDLCDCSSAGVMATLPGIVGTLQANEVIKIITGAGTVLSGKLLMINALTMQFSEFTFKSIPENKNIQILTNPPPLGGRGSALRLINYNELQRLLKTGRIQLVDVREHAEHLNNNIGGINIPISELDENLSLIERNKSIVLYCSTGLRSKHSAMILFQKGIKNVFCLEGGIGSRTPPPPP